MKTQIFKDYSEFLKRTDWTVNGVNEDFSKEYPDYEKQNENNEGCWNCSDCSGCFRCSDCSDCSGCFRCSDCSGCSGCSDCSDCSGCFRCSDCSGCSDCSRCSRCSDCSGCSGCSDCSDCSDLSPQKTEMEIPVIKNIHQKLLAAVKQPNALEMNTWHTCETTHCRAGWVVTLAGEKGKALEKQTSTLFAAMQIYRKSSPIEVSHVRFYDDNKKAMADIEKCAEEESKISNYRRREWPQ